MATPKRNVDRISIMVRKSLEVAKASNAPKEVVDSIASVVNALEQKDNFTEDGCSEDSQHCQNIENETYAHDWKGAVEQGKTRWQYKPEMVCGHKESQFLKSLVSIQKAKRILEVGMFTGYSALSMAEALPADGELVTLDFCDYLKPLVENFIKDSPHGKKIKIMMGDATESIKKLLSQGENFDMVFMDGGKQDYKHQIEMIFDQNLLSPGGTIVVDNAYTQGRAYLEPLDAQNAARIFMNTIKERKDLHRVLLPLNDGVILLRRMSDVQRDPA